jgi:hypothetical protein
MEQCDEREGSRTCSLDMLTMLAGQSKIERSQKLYIKVLHICIQECSGVVSRQTNRGK